MNRKLSPLNIKVTILSLSHPPNLQSLAIIYFWYQRSSLLSPQKRYNILATITNRESLRLIKEESFQTKKREREKKGRQGEREKKEGLNWKKREMFKKFATCHLVGDDLYNYFNETMKRNDRNVTDIFMKHFPFLLKTQTVPLIMG